MKSKIVFLWSAEMIYVSMAETTDFSDEQQLSMPWNHSLFGLSNFYPSLNLIVQSF